MMTQQRQIWIDVLRGIAIIGVLVIHALFSVFARTDFVGGTSWWMANILISFSRMSIPIFIMLSGYLVLSKNETVGQTISRTWWRLGLPFVFWSLFYVWWDMFFFGLTPNWIEYGKQLFFGNMFVLYFLVILIGLYVVAPFIRPFLKENNRKSILIAACVLLLLSAITLLAQYLLLFDHSIWNSFSLWIPYHGYFVIGYWIGHWKDRSSKFTYILGALFLLGYLSTLYFSYMNLIWLKSGISLLWQSSGGGVEYFGEYLSVNVIIMSVAFFALASMYRDQIARLPHVILTTFAAISTAAFGMYVFHSVVLNVLDKRFGFDIQLIANNLWLYMIQKLILTFLITYVCVWCFMRIPYVNLLFGTRYIHTKKN